MLIASERHKPRDIDAWCVAEHCDALHAELARYRRAVQRSEGALLSFAARVPDFYIGVSWGKDSTALADMAQRMCPRAPLVYVRCPPLDNPDAGLVRDAFLHAWPQARYEEIESPCLPGELAIDAAGFVQQLGDDGPWGRGLRMLKRRAQAHVTGIRAEESRGRRIRCKVWGESSLNACAPLAWWRAVDVYAYLYAHRLPVHPAYACTMGGAFDRDRLRVDMIGCEIGQHQGRAGWEHAYYPDAMRRIRSWIAAQPVSA